MDEAEWLASTLPEAMLDFARNRASPRRLRLLVAASSRHVWALLPSPGRDYVLALEQCSDGLLAEGDNEFRRAFQSAADRSLAGFRGTPTGLAYAVNSTGLSVPPTIPSAQTCMDLAAHAAAFTDAANAHDSLHDTAYSAKLELERQVQSQYIRDIFGNPFRRIDFDSGWLTESVVPLAAGIYADRAFDRLPVLADALEDAGCADADLLGHCRGPGLHVRGCWTVDLVLAKA